LDQIVIKMDEEYALDDMGDKEVLIPRKKKGEKEIKELQPNLKKVRVQYIYINIYFSFVYYYFFIKGI